MARNIGLTRGPAILAAAETWIDTCLVDSSSVLTNENLWSSENINRLRTAFVNNPDTSGKSFLEKFEQQLAPLPLECWRLACECLLVLLLFPSNASPATKRTQLGRIWGSAEPPFPTDHPMLSDAVLGGVGSAGTAYFVLRPRELTFLLDAALSIKSFDRQGRLARLKNYDEFIAWMDDVPEEGERQFKHMLRYFAFPDRVERMASVGERRRALVGYGVAPKATVKSWSDRELDARLLALREDLQRENPSALVDYYLAPFKERWQTKAEPDEWTVSEPTARTARVAESAPAYGKIARAQNVIAYGPPGTGKTRWLQMKAAEYTDLSQSVDRTTWINEVLAGVGWRPVIAFALSELKQARVPEIRDHWLVAAKARERGRVPAKVAQTLWGYLSEHTPTNSATVKTSIRREPFIFDKDEDSLWRLHTGWEEEDDESVGFAELIRKGATGSREPIRRYETVTFHPSYSYEDFVRGIRPVSAHGSSTFQMVDGIFKVMCDRARANPAKRYAIFIDEINRANIAKVFGELISLIEADKRLAISDKGHVISGMSVRLPGSDDGEEPEPAFGVPSNLDIFGTMNTADRSIALLDVALRRRFRFDEMAPDYSVLEPVGDVDLSQLLRTINDRLEYFLDRDHRIGHGYLTAVESLDDLRESFQRQVIPLLQEYFFDDFSRVHAVLSQHAAAPPFLERVMLDPQALLPTAVRTDAPSARARYEITHPSTWSEASFIAIYSGGEGARAGR